MILALRTLPEAEAELLEATAWYESKRPGLGAEFIRTVDRALARICAIPEASAPWRKGYPYRSHALRRYPCMIFSTVSPEQVEVPHLHMPGEDLLLDEACGTRHLNVRCCHSSYLILHAVSAHGVQA